jgi:hypothetical protein
MDIRTFREALPQVSVFVVNMPHFADGGQALALQEDEAFATNGPILGVRFQLRGFHYVGVLELGEQAISFQNRYESLELNSKPNGR